MLPMHSIYKAYGLLDKGNRPFLVPILSCTGLSGTNSLSEVESHLWVYKASKGIPRSVRLHGSSQSDAQQGSIKII